MVDRKKMVVAALTGHASMGLLIGAAVAISLFSLFFDVAHQSYVPGLVGLEHLVEGTPSSRPPSPSR
ncbi:hypothetical protein NKG05_04265 [Oerskovia sp. M15]